MKFDFKIFKSIICEYGLNWTFYRMLYTAKLKMLNFIPITEIIFEKKVKVKRIDLFKFNIERIRIFLITLPEQKQREILAKADKAINGVIEGFSSLELDYGNPINWHYNPITKKESSKTSKWFQIPDFDDEIGDIKVIWEASRFTHFFYFARAYLITGDKKYYRAYSEQLKQWLQDNPYPYGSNFKCGQECTLRMINAVMVFAIFDHYGLITAEDEKNLFKLVEVCYKKVLSNFFYAHKCIRNNHTFSEICGLIVGAWCCKDDAKLRKAYKLLDEETKHQFKSDGGYTQYSFNYQRFTLQIFECVCKISEKTGLFISDQSKELIKNSILLMYQVQDETGDVPNYGSNDGAHIFPLSICGYRDFRPTLNTLYAQITGKKLYKPGFYDEELLWFGDDKEYILEDINRVSMAFREIGLCTLRHEYGFLMICLHDFKARPSHMDGLHIDLWHKGRNIFCDSGTYSYASPLNNVTTTAGHNTVKVSGLEQMNQRGAFFIYNWTECKNVNHNENSFSGTMISKNGYEHTRRILKTNHGYMLSDEVIGKGDSCSLLFHTPYKVKIVSDGFEIYDVDEKLCSVNIDSGIIKICKSYRSLYYLKKDEINCVVIKKTMLDNKCNFKCTIELI